MGVGMFISSIFITVIYFLVNHIKYGFIYRKPILINMAVAILLVSIVFACSYIENTALSYVMMGIVSVASVYLSYKSLRTFILSARSIQKGRQDHNRLNEADPMG